MEDYIKNDESIEIIDEKTGDECVINSVESSESNYETNNIVKTDENIENNTTNVENTTYNENCETNEENNYYYSTKNEGSSSEVSNFSTQNDGDSYMQNSSNAFSTNIFENSAKTPQKADSESRTVNISIDMSGATYYLSSEVDIDDIADAIGYKIIEVLNM